MEGEKVRVQWDERGHGGRKKTILFTGEGERAHRKEVIKVIEKRAWLMKQVLSGDEEQTKYRKTTNLEGSSK